MDNPSDKSAARQAEAEPSRGHRYHMPLEEADWQAVLAYAQRNPSVLLFDRRLRRIIAELQAKGGENPDTWEGDQENLVAPAIDHNLRNKFIESHAIRLIRPLSILDPVYGNAANLDVLSIGPRSERELYNLYAHGFHADRLKAIDLISTSPLIEIADMHAIPYPDNRFDVVISAWTLVYSTNTDLALREKVRVTRPGGLICIGQTKEPEGSLEVEQLRRQGSTLFKSSQDIADAMGDAVEEVVFSHDPLDPEKKGAMLLIVRVRKPERDC